MPIHSTRAPVRCYYFAYGSNMSLAQMAERCPSSLLMGTGRIEGFRWHINERGVANVTESSGDFVEGLVYQIGDEDRKRLDRSEGVARGFYDGERLSVQLTPLRNGSLKTFHAAREMENKDQRDFEAREGDIIPSNDYRRLIRSLPLRYRNNKDPFIEQDSWPMTASRHDREEDTQQTKALVYVSREYTSDGAIRQEYIGRMEKAINDARKLGLSDRFLAYIDLLVHRVDGPEEPSEIMRERSHSTTRTQPIVQDQSSSPYDSIGVNQPSRHRHEDVILIERTPDCSQNPISRPLSPEDRHEDSEPHHRPRYETSRTRESQRSRPSAGLTGGSQKAGRSKAVAENTRTWVRVKRNRDRGGALEYYLERPRRRSM